MKKLSLLSFITLISMYLSAQPALTWVRPPWGTNKSINAYSGTMTEPTLGANQTWDFSSYNPTFIASAVFTDPSTLPTNAKNAFPTATYVVTWNMSTTLDKTVIDYYYDCADSLVRLGQQHSGGANYTTWGNVEAVWNLGFGDSALARYQNPNTGKLVKDYFHYSGYGTLKTKYGTYTDVVMISFNGVKNFFMTKPYFAMIMNLVYSAPTTIAGAYVYSYSAGTGISDAVSQNSINISSKNNEINIGLGNSNGVCSVKVLDMLGKTVYQDQHFNATGNNSIFINNPKTGVYIVEVRNDNNFKTAKVFLNN